jgi:hypothetical protein
MGCGSGDAGPAASWASTHPQPAGLSFLDAQQAGLCALSARYPDEAPPAISYQGASYVQADRTDPPAVPPGTEIDHSGDWHIFASGDGSLLLVAPQHAYRYRKAAC